MVLTRLQASYGWGGDHVTNQVDQHQVEKRSYSILPSSGSSMLPDLAGTMTGKESMIGRLSSETLFPRSSS